MSGALSAGQVSLTIRPDTRDFSKLLKGALNGESANWQTMGQNLGKKLAEGIGVALAATAVLATKSAVEMSAANAKIAGSAQLTAKAATAIGDAFLHTAGQSVYSGKQMADAFGPVAGVIQTLTGRTLTQADALTTMKVATTLAEASGQDLGATTANLVRIMQSFHIGLGGAAEASNYLFNASRTTGIGVDELTGSVVKLHGKLGIASPSLKDMSSLIVDLAQHGLTGLRSLMMVSAGLGTLLGGSKATVEALKILNVHVYDSNGKFVGMQSVLEQLTPKLAGMDDKQRHMAETMLFGKAAASALDATIMAGAAGLAKATAAVVTKNAVDKAAEAQSKSYEGVVKMLTATYKDFMVMLGEKIIPILQSVVSWFAKHQGVAIALAVVIGGVMLLAMGLWIASLVSTTVALLSTGVALGILMSPITLIVVLIGGFVAATIYAYTHFKIFKTVVDDVWKWLKTAVVVTINFVKDHWQTILAVLMGPLGIAVLEITKHWDAIKHGFITMLNGLIKAWNFLPWHKDIKLLTDTELPALAAAATKTAATIAALDFAVPSAALNKASYAHPTRGPIKGSGIAIVKPIVAAIVPSSSSSIPDFSGAVAAANAAPSAATKALAAAKKVLAEHKKIAAQLVKDHASVTKIYGQMHKTIADALVAKSNLIKDAGIRDAASQATYDDASFQLHRAFNDGKFKLDRDYQDQKDKLTRTYNDSIAAAEKTHDDADIKLNRTFNDDKFKLDRDYQDQKDKLTRTYNDAIAAAQKTYDDSEVVDKQKHVDALAAIEQTYNDKVAQLTQAAADKRQSIVQKSIDLLTAAFSSATSVDVGKLFDPATGVAGMLDSLKTKLTGATDLSKNASALAAQGYTQTFIQQIVAQGPDIGNSMSDAILAATPETASQLKDLFGKIQDVSDNGVTKLATSMNSGAKLATQALMDEYAQVGKDLQVSLAQEYATFTDSNAKENAAFTATMAASLKTLNDAKVSALLTLNQGLADAGTSYDNSLFDMKATLNQGLADSLAALTDAKASALLTLDQGSADAAKSYSDSLFDMTTTLNNGLADARDVLNKALLASATQFNTDMDNLQTSTMAKMATLMASLQSVANAIAKISGASVGQQIILDAPVLPKLVTASSGSLDSATAAARAAAVSGPWNGALSSAYNSQVPAAARADAAAQLAATKKIADAVAAQASQFQTLARQGGPSITAPRGML